MRLDLTLCFEHAIMCPRLCFAPWCFILFHAALHFIFVADCCLVRPVLLPFLWDIFVTREGSL